MLKYHITNLVLILYLSMKLRIKTISTIFLLFFFVYGYSQELDVNWLILFNQNKQTNKELKLPSFPGGNVKLKEFLEKELKNQYIVRVKAALKISINEKGKIEKVKIQQISDTLLSNKVILIIRNMPDWEPMIESNTKVNTSIGLMITLSSGENLEEQTYPVLKVGSKAPTFRTKDIYGKDFYFEHQTKKIFCVVFWAAWCEPCIKELPDLVKTQKRYSGKNIEFISISYDIENKRKDYKDIINKYNMNWTQLFQDAQSDSSLLKTFGIDLLPTFIIIKKEGIIYKGSGSDSLREVWNILNKEIKK